MTFKNDCPAPGKRSRVPSEERFRMIVEAAAPLFAKTGFSGTTTKQIAKAAGVSEALLYKHFTSKDEIYMAMQNSVCSPNSQLIHALLNLPPGTDALVLSLYYFFVHIVIETEKMDKDKQPGEDKILKRLMMQSLLEDGHFAKLFIESRMEPVIGMFTRSLEEGIKSGDFNKNDLPSELGVWLGHHLAIALSFMALPGTPIVDYGCPREETMFHAVRFTLRGLGMKEDVLNAKLNKEYLNAQLDLLKIQLKAA